MVDRRQRRAWASAVALTCGILLLVGAAVGGNDPYFTPLVLVVVTAGVSMFALTFPGSRFFSLALANFLGVYICIYAVFLVANFRGTSEAAGRIGFVLPIVAFLGGVWWRRESIRAIAGGASPADRSLRIWVFGWLVPVFAIGFASFALPAFELSPRMVSALLLIAMSMISIVVFWVSRQVCLFLLETGLLFESFFQRMRGLIAPAFAFFTFYSLILVIFACAYRVIDRISEGQNFLVLGEARDITFIESLYFSIITLSAVGYGDIVPVSTPVRMLVSLEILSGVVLMLFGFSEIIRYAREQARGGQP